jgi:deoxyadenosine/deoxycytidine kinase
MSIGKETLHIAVAGNIGAGKTTLVKKLSSQFGWEAHFESVDDNPYLEDFYSNMKQWSFPLQIYFLHSRFNQVVRIKESPNTIIQDRTIYEDAHIFAKNLYGSGLMEKRDFENYFSLFQSMSKQITPPDLLIYLRSNISTLIDHISQRGREYENNISIKYLEDLNQQYEDWIAHYTHGKVLIINVSECDYVNNPEDLSYVFQKVQGELYGLF